MKESLGQYRARDGNLLSLRKWGNTGDVILYLHGIESNSAWFSRFASRLNENGFAVYGIDRRGSGLNSEGRGDINNYKIFLDDIEDALNFVRGENPGKKVFLLGICWGALLAVNCAATNGSIADGLILISPAIYRRVDLSVSIKAIAKICYFLKPGGHFKIPIKDSMFTTNKKYLDFIKKDPQRLRTLSCRFFNEIIRMEKDLSHVNHKITLPACVALAGHDEIVDNAKVKEWFRKIEFSDKTMEMFEDMHHVMPFDEDLDSLITFISGWAKKRGSI